MLVLVAVVGFGVLAMAGNVDKKVVNGGSWSLDETGGTMTLTVDAVSSAAITATTLTPTTVNVSGVSTFNGLVRVPTTASSLTNGQALAIAKSHYTISAINGTANTTNTITLSEVAAGVVGSYVDIVVASGSTQLLSIADSGFAYLSSAWVGGSNDVITLYVAATNRFIECSASDN
jgi:hypothetical protein